MSQDKLFIVKGLLIGSALISYKAALLIAIYKQYKQDKDNKEGENKQL